MAVGFDAIARLRKPGASSTRLAQVELDTLMHTRYDVVGLGNAIVDVLSAVEEEFLIRLNIPKGRTNLIDADRAEELYAAMPQRLELSGGSGANTIAGLASFGASVGFMGKVADDALGATFRAGLTAAGVAFPTAPLVGGAATARSMIVVTPDGQRSMNTFLGASTEFSEHDVDADLIASGAVTYLEGYLFDREAAKSAYVRAAELARASGRKVSLTLSDVFCVARHRASFRHLIKGHVDLVFANEAELLALFETDDFDAALAAARAETPLIAVTRSERGSVVADAAGVVSAQALRVPAVVDTTGAGDQYAAGFLWGWARGRPHAACAALGHLAAAEVIGHFGARPETSYAALAQAAGL
jgi:sugar/nucleoside kinase (ribokinase family)